MTTPNLKKSTKSPAERGNIQKFAAYTEAFARIKSGLDTGHPIEAIAIEEAILSDRISSHLTHYKSMPGGEYPAFGNLIKKWEKLSSRLQDNQGEKLAIKTKTWKDRRNAAIHGLVKSDAGMPPTDTDSFLEEANETAQEGLTLVRDVLSWHQKEKARKETK